MKDFQCSSGVCATNEICSIFDNGSHMYTQHQCKQAAPCAKTVYPQILLQGQSSLVIIGGNEFFSGSAVTVNFGSNSVTGVVSTQTIYAYSPYNLAVGGYSVTVTIDGLSSPSCSATVTVASAICSSNGIYPETAASHTATYGCGPNEYGYATIACNSTGNWETPSNANCQSCPTLATSPSGTSSLTGCMCPMGYFLNTTGSGYCQDIDECDTGNSYMSQCNLISQGCVNTPGSYYCVCLTGYDFVNGSCTAEPRLMESLYYDPLAIWLFDGNNQDSSLAGNTFNYSGTPSYVTFYHPGYPTLSSALQLSGRSTKEQSGCI